jgi:XTP/dITP diphosphohydrolase
MTTAAPVRRLVLATGNPGKIRELRDLLSDQRIEVLAQSDFDVGPVEETGLTFIENALLKARHASGQTGLAAIADDSGLVVDGLGGRPGKRRDTGEEQARDRRRAEEAAHLRKACWCARALHLRFP